MTLKGVKNTTLKIDENFSGTLILEDCDFKTFDFTEVNPANITTIEFKGTTIDCLRNGERESDVDVLERVFRLGGKYDSLKDKIKIKANQSADALLSEVLYDEPWVENTGKVSVPAPAVPTKNVTLSPASKQNG